MNPLQQLREHGQSVWLDYIRRGLITSGELGRLIAEDGLAGVTSNPAIFEKAIAGSNDYTARLEELAARRLGPVEIYEALAVQDIQDAADALLGVYRETRRKDGYVSLEVAPTLAHDGEGTVAEGRRLWRAVGRDNVMIKVPATEAGIPAIRRLLAEGINVNITLLFSAGMWERVAEAWLLALEERAGRGEDLAGVASVASFFVSRIDSAVDAELAERIKAADGAGQERLRGLLGKAAIANARLVYQRFGQLVAEDRFLRLAARGAMPQRLLWASTSTKNPRYRDVLYVEELIGPDTVNTIPPATLDAFRDHGKPRPSLAEGLEEARASLAGLAAAGVSLEKVTDELVVEGVRLFAEPFAKLLGTIEQKSRVRPAHVSPGERRLPAELAAAAAAALDDWTAGQKVQRLWARDASLWTGKDEGSWLGWLGVVAEETAEAGRYDKVAGEVREARFASAALLGMGGSSLFPEVLASTFAPIPGYPRLLVLDSTDPDQIRALEQKLDLSRTLFIVSSKSGTTLEPNVFLDYFLERTRAVLGAEPAGRSFVAITDPGSKLHERARGEGFRRVFLGVPGIGGRYSALSAFGLVPAAAIGLDVPRLLDRAGEMVEACAACVPPRENPGVTLGVVLGAAATQGRDKLTIVASPRIASFGAWLEQLVAESTGKEQRGIIPVDLEMLGDPQVYGADRLFAYLRLETEPDPGQDRAVAALERAGQPVVRIAVADVYDLGAEVFRWELATAVAGERLGIHPFDQPDVEASKLATRVLTDEVEKTGALPVERPFFAADGLALHADSKTAGRLLAAVSPPSLGGLLAAHLATLGPGDYLALLVYLERSEASQRELQALRHALRDRHRVATCLGFGPRFLHSTGQAYKGGPNSGVFLQLTADPGRDLAVPGRSLSFGTIEAAQARGDFQVLVERGRRALRVHLGSDVAAGFARLRQALGVR